MLLQAAIGFSLLIISTAFILFIVVVIITSTIRFYKVRNNKLPFYEKTFDIISKSTFFSVIDVVIVIVFFFIWSVFIDFM